MGPKADKKRVFAWFTYIILGLAIAPMCVSLSYAHSPLQKKAWQPMSTSELPFLEVDPHPAIEPPAGYRAYLARDWDHYMVIQAEAVMVRPDSPTGNELFFEYGGGGILTARAPHYPGELSHLFLPLAFVVPQEVARLRAKPVPTVLVSRSTRPRAVFRFREEPLPAGAPAGSKAYRGEFETFVFTGVVTGITGKPSGGFTFDRGSAVQIRKSVPGDPNGISHIIVPPGYALPQAFIDAEGAPTPKAEP